MQEDKAQTIAVEGLNFIASDPDLMLRFLALTGIEARHIREAASEPGFLAGVLQFILAHQPTLLAFSEASGTEPQQVAAAHQALPFGDGRWDIQP